MQSTLSTEIWERMIDLVAQSNNPRRWDFQWRERDLCACILVTRSWVHRSRFHLFNYILLDSDRRTKRFLYALTLSPDLSKYVTALEVYPDDPDGPHDWIYRALFSLPRRIPHLHKLTFYGLPYLHSNLITRLSCFKMVESLELHRLDRQSFREIILIVNRFPRLQRLYVHRCEWDWPIAYYSGKNRKLLSLQAHEFSNSQHSEDVLSWALASKSTSNLTTFSAIISPTESPGFDSTISRILQNCRSTLREVEFNIIGDAEIPMLMDHTGLELLRIRGYTKSALLWLSRLDSFAPSSLLGISLEILGDFPGVHHEYSKTQWKTVDVALYDPKFRNLISFELQDHWHQPESHAELHPVFQRILPRSYERGILWHVRNNGGRVLVAPEGAPRYPGLPLEWELSGL